MQIKDIRKLDLSIFCCRITLSNGEKKYTYIEAPPNIIVAGTKTYKDKQGNIFKYDIVRYKDKLYEPQKLNCELFSQSEGKFADNFKIAYFDIYKQVEVEQDFEFALENIKAFETKEQLKKYIKEMNITPYQLYYNEFDKIYLENTPQKTTLTKEELEFLRNRDLSQRITRKTAFLLLLFRNRNNNDFLLECDINDSFAFEELFEKFHFSFRKAKKNM
ncbi:MAG: hypothetical protein K8I03_14525 [Ignavibacteria bacterium]|nr:hypothetical protein [Ignavibacteria bacterium]